MKQRHKNWNYKESYEASWKTINKKSTEIERQIFDHSNSSFSKNLTNFYIPWIVSLIDKGDQDSHNVLRFEHFLHQMFALMKKENTIFNKTMSSTKSKSFTQ